MTSLIYPYSGPEMIEFQTSWRIKPSEFFLSQFDILLVSQKGFLAKKKNCKLVHMKTFRRSSNYNIIVHLYAFRIKLYRESINLGTTSI